MADLEQERVTALRREAAAALAEPSNREEFDAMEVLVTLPPYKQVATLRWLNSRVESDLRKGRAAAAAVGKFLFFGARADPSARVGVIGEQEPDEDNLPSMLS